MCSAFPATARFTLIVNYISWQGEQRLPSLPFTVVKNKTEKKESSKAQPYLAAVIGVGLLLWLVMARPNLTSHTWQGSLLLLAAVPLIIICDPFRITFPLLGGWA